jgi:hypothetical protein
VSRPTKLEHGVAHRDILPQALLLGEEVGELNKAIRKRQEHLSTDPESPRRRSTKRCPAWAMTIENDPQRLSVTRAATSDAQAGRRPAVGSA